MSLPISSHRVAGALLFVFLAAPVFAAADAPAAEPPGKPETYRPPAGAYQHLWIDFAGGDFARKGGEKIAPRAFVGLRGGASTTAWFLSSAIPGGVAPHGTYKAKIDATSLKLTADSLTGSINLRQVSTWAPMTRLAVVTITIDAKRTGPDITGNWTTQILNGAKASGTLTGKLTEEPAIRAAQSFAAQAEWPSYYGPYNGNRASDTKQPILDDIAKVKPLWRSEEPLGAGWGCGDGPVHRPLKTAAAGPCGGASSPVFANGRVFQFHYVPSGSADPTVVEQSIANSIKVVPDLTRLEKDLITTGLRQLSDTIVTCIDPQTGGTLWRTTVPRLSGNFQAHKWRGLNPTCTVMGDVVVATDYGKNSVGLKADTGEALWVVPVAQKITANSAVVGPVYAAGLAILQGSELRAVKPNTGEIVWKAPGGSEALRWTSSGTDRLIVLGLKSVRCLDAATGQQLWAESVSLYSGYGSAALVSGDLLVGFAPADDPKLRGHGKPQGWKLSASGMQKVWEDELLPNDENLTVTFGPARVYVQGREEIRAIDLATGKVAAKIQGREAFTGLHGPGSNPWLAVIGNRLLMNPEGQHGGQGFLLMDLDLKPLSAWRPPHNHDSAYAYMAMISPVVDGRWFIRGNDGLYCYDLRP